MPVGNPETVSSRSILAYLALDDERSARRETLMRQFWPGAPVANARNNVKTALSMIRTVFRAAGFDPETILHANRDVVRIVCDVETDLFEIERCAAADAGDRVPIVALRGAEFLPGDCHAWAVARRHRVASSFEQLLRAELAMRPSIDVAERLLGLSPFSHEAYVVLLEDALASGSHVRARTLFRRYASALAEIGEEPNAELRERVGIRLARTTVDVGFLGRATELAAIRAWLADPAAPRTLLVSGIAGIGKTALVNEAIAGAHAVADISVLDGAPSSETPCLRRDDGKSIVCVRPERLAEARGIYRDAFEIRLAGLSRDEIAVALARSPRASDLGMTSDSLWNSSLGHPLLLEAELRAVVSGDDATAIRYHRAEVRRRFEEQLDAAGEDAIQVAALVWLEPALDDDDLVALLDWSLRRVVEAVDALVRLGVLDSSSRPASFAYPTFATILSRRSSAGRRRETIESIAERLRLHEDPLAKRNRSRHLSSLGRQLDAALALLEAGNGFMLFASWNNALAAFDDGIALLETSATSSDATSTLRELYLKRADVLNQLGRFIDALRSIDAALDLSDADDPATAPLRASMFVRAGHAFAHLNDVGAAWISMRRAEDVSDRFDVVEARLGAAELASRLLCNERDYEHAVSKAHDAYDRATSAGKYEAAASLAQRIGEPLRRLLRFDESLTWAELQFDAAATAGPEHVAQALLARATAAFAVWQVDRAEERCREALDVLATIKRRRTRPLVPIGFIEWRCHHALAYVYVERQNVDAAIGECAWLVRSPWALNTTGCSVMTLSVVTNAWLASEATEHRLAALAFARRVPAVADENPAAFLDLLTRARLAALDSSPAQVVDALRRAHEAIVRAETQVPHQIYISYEKLGAAARGFDDDLADRAYEAGRRHRSRVAEAAGTAWAADARATRSASGSH